MKIATARKIDILMHQAALEGMEEETAARFIRDFFHQPKWYIMSQFAEFHGDVDITRVNNSYVNLILSHIGYHIGVRGNLSKNTSANTPKVSRRPAITEVVDPVDSGMFTLVLGSIVVIVVTVIAMLTLA